MSWSRGQAVEAFAVVKKQGRDTGKRLESDWGSSGRRFKSCQPDAGHRRFGASKLRSLAELTHTWDPDGEPSGEKG
jgi:hypothetical protein